MIRKIILTILTVHLCAAYSLGAQRWTTTYLTDRDGMSHSRITKILQDKFGFIWFSSWNGLNRYDGYEFATFKSQPGDGKDLVSDRIRNMTLGKDGNIYCLVDEEVWRFNLTTYQFENLNKTASNVYHAKIKAEGGIKSEYTVTIGDRQYDNIRQDFIDSQHNHWLMGDYGIYKVTPITQYTQPLSAVPSDIIRCLYRDQRGRIWITGRNTKTITILDNQAKLLGYLGTDGRLHSAPQKFASIYTVFQQSNGTIWLGSKPQGLFRLQEISTGCFSIEHLQKGTTQDVAKGKTISSNNIYDIKEDRNGRLWLATQFGGINMMEEKSGRRYFHNYSNSFRSFPQANNKMRRILIVGDTSIVATSTEGLVVIPDISVSPDKMKFRIHRRESQRIGSLSCSATMDMLIDNLGHLFVSTESGGVNMLLTQDLNAQQFEFRHFTTNNGLGTDVIMSMAKAGEDILVQGKNQISRINVKRSSMENYNSLFFSVTNFSDAEPFLLDNDNWLIPLETGVTTISESAFKHHGPNQHIVITSISIPGSRIDYASNVCDTIRLKPSERNITIKFAALDYTNNTNIKYSTRVTRPDDWTIESHSDSLWTPPDADRVLNLFSLTPGMYKVEIRSTTPEGLWAANTRTIYIDVQPAIWETSIAKILYFIIAIAVIFGIVYTILYIRTLRRQREENLSAYLNLFEQQNTAEVIATTPNVTHKSNFSEEDNLFMQRLITFVDANISNSDIGVDEMAKATATSRSSLNRRTKSLLGITPADFLKEARMKNACQLLLSTQRTVNDIAFSCGFTDPKYFSKCFKATMGKSPSEYRAIGQ